MRKLFQHRMEHFAVLNTAAKFRHTEFLKAIKEQRCILIQFLPGRRLWSKSGHTVIRMNVG